MLRILFVDDEPLLLPTLETSLRRYRRQWDTAFAVGPKAALEALANGHFDVVVSDMRMPGMSGVDLLRHVRERHPGMIRIILSGYSSGEDVEAARTLAHRFLNKPCDVAELVATIRRLVSERPSPAAQES